MNWREKLSVLADLLQVAGFFGITASVILAAVGAALGLTISWTLALIVGLALGVGSLVVFAYWPFPFGTLPLREASRIAYERLDGSLLAYAAERMGKTPEGVLVYFATYISREVPILGKRPPSTKLKEIGSTIFNQGRFCDGGNSFKYHGKQDPAFVDLAIRRGDFQRMVREVKKEYEASKKDATRLK